MDVFSIRDPLPSGTVMLEASAGTGKTWTIGALVTRYVAEGVATLDELLVVTFGRAASQELRERVREHLLATERALASPETADRHDELVEVLLDGSPSEVAERHRRLRAALAEFDAATIATTHQFCQLVLRGLGVAGDTDSGAMLVEDLDALLVEVVDDTYLRGFGATTEPPIFSRAEALTLARVAVGDPQAALQPDAAPSGSAAARRVAFAQHVRRELDRRKRRLGVLSFDDLLSQLADALADPAAPARERMRRRWKIVLVDEFQDTDPVQWQVLDRAFSGASTLILIGDPKQAIYAFRGGDVVTYLAAQRTAATRKTLGHNWRSDAPLVAAQQAVLRGAALGDDQIVVHDVAAHHQGSRLAGLPAEASAPWRMRVLSRAQLGTTADRKALVGQSRPAIARDLAADVRRLLGSGATFEGRPIQAGDLAVLAHTGAQLDVVQRALRAVGVASVLAATGSVLQSAAGRDWLAVLEAMEQPHRSARVRAAALTPLIGASAVDLDANAEERTDDVAALLRRWAALHNLRGIPAVVEAATTAGLPQRVLAQVGGERTLTDLRHVGEILHDVALRDGLGLVALTAWLRRQVSDEGTDAATPRSRRLDSDAHAVQLATVHKSKGLQYPVVYLPFVGDRWVREDAFPLYHRGSERCLDVGGSPDDPTLAAARAEDDGENLRLFYVALTRAQSQVITWWAPITNAVSSSLQRVLLGRQPGGSTAVPSHSEVGSDEAVRARLRAWQDAGGPVCEEADDLPASQALPREKPIPLAVRPFTRVIDEGWRRTSYTALSAVLDEATGATSEIEEPAKDDEPPVPEPALVEPPGAQTAASGLALDPREVPSPMTDLPVGATFGSLVHGVLEEADPQAADLRAELVAQIREQIVRWPVPDLDQAALADALVSVCTSPLGPLADDVTLAGLGRRDRLCEMNFELPLAGGDLPRDRPDVTLGDMGPLLRQHLPAGDPLLAYADALEVPELGGQSLRGYLTGSVDVVLRVNGRYLVVDYKTNWLGPIDEPLTAAAYGPRQLAAAMGHSSYPLQALLYAVVLHRFLRWRLPSYDPQQHLGGVLYLYVRGMCGPQTPVIDGHPTGVFSWKPPVVLVEALSDLLDGRLGEGGAA